ncbi:MULTISPECIES: hypothetical protein [unclassified Pseudomonas]|uniref:hypothetical protein n=1 Tax=unclassified Pseudomonas TaxID=196821 RepID=UPI000483DF52|nr:MULTISPECIES: hypothetical protein [unclassified Pseudomonas]
MLTEINYFLIDSGSDSTATWVAITSLAVSIGALIVAAWQTRMTRSHNKLSVKPNLAIDVSQDGSNFSAVLKNTGFGPAKITKSTLYLDGVPQAGQGTALIESAFKSIPHCELFYTEFFHPPYVLPTSGSVQLFKVEFDDKQIGDFRDYIMTRLKLEISYTCFYEDVQFFSSDQ